MGQSPEVILPQQKESSLNDEVRVCVRGGGGGGGGRGYNGIEVGLFATMYL